MPEMDWAEFTQTLKFKKRRWCVGFTKWMCYGQETHPEESIRVAKQSVNFEIFHLQPIESPSFSTPCLVFLPSMHGKTLWDKTTLKLGKLYSFRSSNYEKTFTSQPQALIQAPYLSLNYYSCSDIEQVNSSSVAVTWIASVMHCCLQKRWPSLRDGHQTNTSFTTVLQQGKDHAV